MKVKAIKRGTWPAHRERAVGEVFDYNGPTKKKVGGKPVSYFPSWMEKMPEPKPDPDDDARKAAEKEAAEKAAAEKDAAEKAEAEKAAASKTAE